MSEIHGNRFVLQRIQQRGITQVELWYQLAGGVRSVVYVAATELETIFDDGLVIDHPGPKGGGSLVLVPDAGTFIGVSGESIRAGEDIGPGRLVCDLQRLDGAPHPLCARTALKRGLARAAQGGDRFYLGGRIDQRWICTPTSGGAEGRYLGSSAAQSQLLSQRLARRMERDGHAIRSWASGAGAEHWSFEYNWVDPLTLCDTLATHRVVARSTAHAAGHEVTFMRRPWRDAVPAGLELYLSRDERGGQSWGDPLASSGLSAEGRAFAARLEASESALALVFRHGLHGRKSSEPVRLEAIAQGRGLEGAAVRVVGLDALVDPYLVTAAILALALGADTPDGVPREPSQKPARDPARVLTPDEDRVLEGALGAALVATLRAQAQQRLAAYWDELSAHELQDELLA